MIENTFADIFIWYEDGIDISQNRGKTDTPCIKIWFIQSLEMDFLKWNASAINDYKIWVSPFWRIEKSYIYSMWIFKNSEWNWISYPWLLQKVNEENYIPELWDYIIAKINPENNYINELFLQNKKSINDIITFSKTLNLPECKLVVEKNENITNTSKNYQEYIFIWILVLLLIIIWVLIFKIYKLKR